VYFGKIFSFTVVSENLNSFIDFLVTKKPNSPKIVAALTMNELLQVRNLLDEPDFLIPDGMPMVWLLKLLRPESERIYGPDVMSSVFKNTASGNKKHYFYGSSPEVLTSLINKITKDYPQLNIVGQKSPPFGELTKDEEQKHFSKIKRAKPDFIWIGLGGKKQVETSLRLRDFLASGAYIMTVGAAFDFISGNKKQAPRIIQQLGLEWFFRLLSEPKRLWKRYVLQIPIFLVIWFVEAVKIVFSNKKNRIIEKNELFKEYF
jgi:N-acetylglucosaminyldiphosphoundecaprenol N-acetyl-beta-D-mannosaminyltransferase